jgi:hypothetical protein
MPPKRQEHGHNRDKRPRDEEDLSVTSGPSQQSMAVGAQAPPGKVAVPALKNPGTVESTKGLKQVLS